jgi:hypothetical protein
VVWTGLVWLRIGLHGVVSQKIELFATTAVRTSDPASNYNVIVNETLKFLLAFLLI